MALRRSAHIIFNPTAGARKRDLLERVIKRLNQAGVEITLDETKGPGHATELAAAAARHGIADVIVAAGGDGTINEVARGLLGQGAPLGIIPLGTANVLAIELGLKPREGAIADMLLAGPAQLIGTGLVEDRIFLLMVGIGFDGEVVHDINARMKRVFGKAAFVWSGLKLWFSGPGRDIVLRVDGQEKHCAWAVVNNGRYFAGPYVLAPDANIEDPGLTLTLFKSGSRFAFARYFAALGLGRVHRLKDVEIIHPRRIEALSPEGLAVEVDGDARGTLPQTIAMGIHFLRLVVPAR